MQIVKILTAGKSAELVIDYLTKTLSLGCDFNIELYDDVKYPSNVLGFPIKGKLTQSAISKDDLVVIATGHMELRRFIFNAHKDAKFITINRSNIREDCLGISNLIFPDVSFDLHSSVGDNNVISAGTVISHHCKIGVSNLFGPGCLLSGSVTIGNNCTFGSGVIFQPYVNVADNTTIPSGCVVVGNIDSHIKAHRHRGILTGKYFIGKNR